MKHNPANQNLAILSVGDDVKKIANYKMYIYTVNIFILAYLNFIAK